MMIRTIGDFRRAIRQGSSTDFGGYPLFFIMADSEALCPACASENRRECLVALAYSADRHDGWRPYGLEINFEDPALSCAHCNKRIPSAYAEDEAMPRYQVSSFDVCASGMERLRNRDEFLLVATINPSSTASELTESWLGDLDACMRPDSFDFDAARACVRSFAEAQLPGYFAKGPNPFNLDEPVDSDDHCSAFLFVRDANGDEANA